MIYFIVDKYFAEKDGLSWSYTKNGYYFTEPVSVEKIGKEVKIRFKNYGMIFTHDSGKTYEELSEGAGMQPLSEFKKQFRQHTRIPKHIFDSLFFI